LILEAIKESNWVILVYNSRTFVVEDAIHVRSNNHKLNKK